MNATLNVARAVAKRNLRHALKNPALLLPSLLFPLLFLLAFAGGLSALGNAPGFHYAPGYTGFQFVFVFLQAAAFGGVFSAFALAADFESGFARRIMVAAPHRTGIVLGYVISAFVRFVLTGAVVFVAGLIGGMKILGTGIDVFGLIGLAFIVNVVAVLFGAGVALRARTLQAGPFMQLPIFLTLMIAPVYVPLPLLSGWIKAVASVNPATAILQAGRGFLAGVHQTTGLAFACAVALALVLAIWAVRGVRKAESAG